MVIFHSYVSLPEGSSDSLVVENIAMGAWSHGPLKIDDIPDLRTLKMGMFHFATLNRR